MIYAFNAPTLIIDRVLSLLHLGLHVTVEDTIGEREVYKAMK